MNHQEKRLIVLACFGHMVAHYNMAVFPALVLPLAGALGLGMAQVLSLSFWQYLLFGVSALPWGLAGDRVGARPLLYIMFLGSAVGAGAAAFRIDSPQGLALALATMGLFSGIYHPIGMGILSKGVGRLSVAMGYNAAFGGLGLVLAPLVTGIANWLAGPKAPFLITMALNAIGLLLMIVCPLPTQGGHESAEQPEENDLRLGAFCILLLATMLGGVAFTSATVVFPSFLELKGGAIVSALGSLWSGGLSGNLVATTITALVYSVGMVGQYVGGHMGDSHEPRFTYLLFHAMCVPAAALMAYASGVPLAGLAMVYFFFLLGTQAPENTLVAHYTPKRFHHSAFGFKFVLVFGVGSIGVKAAGWIETAYQVETVFLALAAVSVAISATIVGLIALTPAARRAEA